MEPAASKFWDERLRNFEQKSVELREKTIQLEDEIKDLEGSLYQKNITAYRTSLLDRAKKSFIKTFRERDDLPPEHELKDEWEKATALMSACITIIRSIDTEEAGVCSGAEELKNFLKTEIEAQSGPLTEDIAELLEIQT